MEAKLIKGNSLTELQGQLEACIDESYRPTLCIFFCSINQDFHTLRQLMAAYDLQVFGATSAGEIVNDFRDALS